MARPYGGGGGRAAAGMAKRLEESLGASAREEGRISFFLSGKVGRQKVSTHEIPENANRLIIQLFDSTVCLS